MVPWFSKSLVKKASDVNTFHIRYEVITMDKMNNNNTSKVSNVFLRTRSYSKPILKRFGSISQLTKGGSGNASENNNGGARPRL